MACNGCEEVSKSQAVRLADVWLIGPLMIWAGLQKRRSMLVNYSLIGLGIGTVLYNGRNYLATRKGQVSTSSSRSTGNTTTSSSSTPITPSETFDLGLGWGVYRE
jgi:hypothetical protein